MQQTYIPPLENIWGMLSSSIRCNREMTEKMWFEAVQSGLWMCQWLEEFGLEQYWSALEYV